MKILHRWVLRSFVPPLILTFFLAIFVLLMQFLWKYIDELVGKGLDWWVLTKLLFYASATFVPMALPLAVLLASLMTFGSLGEHYELIAVKSSGISFRKLTQPYFILIAFLAAFAFYFNNNVLPKANLKMYSLLFSVKEQKPTFNLQPGVFYNEIEGYIIKIAKKDKDGKTVYHVIIFDQTQPGRALSITIAKKGKTELTQDKRTLVLTLYDGINYSENRNVNNAIEKKSFQRIQFKEEILRLDMSGLSSIQNNEALFKGHYQMMNIVQLKRQIDTLQMEFASREEEYLKQTLNVLYFYRMHFGKTFGNASTTTFLSLKKWDDIAKQFDEVERKKITQDAATTARSHLMLVDNHKREKKANKELIMRHHIELYRKFTLAIACIIMFLIGAPLGAIIRKGGFGLPLVVAILIFIFYYMLSIIFEKFVREMTIGPFIGMWASTFITLPIGIWLLYNVIQEKPILELDAWNNRFIWLTKRIKGIFAKNHSLIK